MTASAGCSSCVSMGPLPRTARRGLVVLSNGDNDAMLFNCAMARAMLEGLGPVAGLDLSTPDPSAGFDSSGPKQEEIVTPRLQEPRAGRVRGGARVRAREVRRAHGARRLGFAVSAPDNAIWVNVMCGPLRS